MRKFDPIDIFFIAIISAYFITLICLGITFLCIAFSKKKKEKKLESLEVKEVVVKEETPVLNQEKKVQKEKLGKNSRNIKEKLASVPLFRKLFMREVNHDKEKVVSTKVLEPEKVKIEETEKIVVPIK